MIDNMIKDMIESEIDVNDIVDCLVNQYDVSHDEALEAIHEVLNEM
ncbi:hypothetical protein pp2_140 [Vibrio phage phi-pp2]|uniref:Uncharacterized protein n=2 Tax=Schizotequatrovirus KVP40 TaxID=1914019 RepID=A0A6H0X9B9_9CAUD|nr:hypothetical protein pp2_140 [Vibrio phage phi-pp2]QIW90895.1 hypothetical protein COHAPHLL_00032 [Vibrio phage V09]